MLNVVRTVSVVVGVTLCTSTTSIRLISPISGLQQTSTTTV
jgi:hypothetical protein